MDDNGFRVLIAGGGVAAIEATLTLQELVPGLVRVELLAPEPYTWYRPAAVAVPFALGEVRRFELAELAAAAGATFVPGALAAVDTYRRIAHTSAGAEIDYDALLIACGATPTPAIVGAITFRGPADTDAVSAVLAEVEAGEVRRIAFAAPWGAAWLLPIYELVLMTSAWAAARAIDLELSLVTPEHAPLELFGSVASQTVSALLDERGINVYAGAYAVEVRDGGLIVLGSDPVPADRVVAVPRLEGPAIAGIPQTIDGFIAVDAHGRVPEVEAVFAAGDVTSFPVKQGGLAAQQADAAAEAIAAMAGADIVPEPFRPVLRGLLLTGGHPQYLRHVIADDEDSVASETPLWWPPAKVVGRRLAPFLAATAGLDMPKAEPPGDAVSVDVELTPELVERLTARQPKRFDRGDISVTVGEVMTGDPLLVAPEDTLGEVAERMRVLGGGCALVVGYGRLIGILTDVDVIASVAARAHPSEARVRQWMTAEPVAIDAAAGVDEAAALMSRYGIHRLAVVDGKHPVGVIGRRSLAEALPVELPGVGLGF